ncbi:MAG: HDIG domain-containing protein [bacterium]|nr:MAG: HDIG domain-containing protein [bacterium]
MAEQNSNGKDRGEGSTWPDRFNPRDLLSSLTAGGYLPLVYLGLFLACSLLLFPPTQKVKDIRYKEGDIADIDVIAPFTFFVPLGEREIEENRTTAAANIPPVYSRNEDVERLLPNDLKTFMRSVSELTMQDTLPTEERLAMIRDFAPILRRDPVELLLEDRTREQLSAQALKLQGELLRRGVINDASPLQRGTYARITVLSGDSEDQISARPLIEQGELEGVIIEQAKKLFNRDEDKIKLFYSIVRSHLTPNLVYDMTETKRRRDEAESEVPKSFKVSKNQRIVAKHDKVTRKQLNMLEALERRRMELELETSHWKHILLFVSKALRIVVLLLLLGMALHRLRRDLMSEPGKLTLVFIIVMIYMLLMALVVKVPDLNAYLIPVAFVSLLSTAFFGIMTSVMLTLFASLMVVTHTSLPASHVFTGILAGTAAIISIAQLRERKNFYRIFLYVSLAYIIGIMGFGARENISVGGFLLTSLWGITNSFVCTILVMFLMPIFESISDVTTNFTLMELSDLNRPILRRLLIEAPGTYHHSIMVGNMVEAVAEDVKANGLLARVGAYYHDIGKIAKPEYFFENKGDNVNKHEKLSPTMSALILASHIKEGVELAKKEKLPKVIIDAIREHQGTTVMAYFYQKALEYDSHDSVNIDDFRYPGPKPQSKETALIMLADSAEAAVRSLKEPTAPRIRAIVSKIIEARMNDGELDQSRLTLNDIAVIKEQFIQLLTGIFHPRISYPQQEDEEQKRERAGEDNSQQQARSERSYGV